LVLVQDLEGSWIMPCDNDKMLRKSSSSLGQLGLVSCVEP
jgi:hypothetical protein